MGKDTRSKELSTVGQTAQQQYQNLYQGPTDLEKEMIPISQEYQNRYNVAADRQMGDYGDIMGGYTDFANNLGGPTNFGFERVGAERVAAERPAELGESYGYLREAVPGYRDFAATGGYSPTDIQELRARGIEPIRSAYGNTMMEMDRARALGGAGGAPNYIAAASKAQREYPGQMADAMTTVNAELANSIRQGKLAGLAGLTGVGGTMGGLSSQEAQRMLQAAVSNQGASLQAAMANQGADLQAQQLSEQSLQNLRQNQLNALSGKTSLYGTTPAMAAMFGNQAQNAYSQRANLEQMRNQYGLGLLGIQNQAYGNQTQQEPWWKTALNVGSSVLPYVLPGGKTSGTNPAYPGATNVSEFANPNPGDPSWYEPYSMMNDASNYNKTGWYAGSPYQPQYNPYLNPTQSPAPTNAGVPYNPFDYKMYDYRAAPITNPGGGSEGGGRYDPFFGWTNS